MQSSSLILAMEHLTLALMRGQRKFYATNTDTKLGKFTSSYDK